MSTSKFALGLLIAVVMAAGVGLGARIKDIELGKEGEQCRTPTSS